MLLDKILVIYSFLQSRAQYLKTYQMKYFIILAVLRRSVLRVCGAYLRVIVPAGNTARFKEMSQRWRAVGNAVYDLIAPRFKPQISRSRDGRVTARPTSRF